MDKEMQEKIAEFFKTLAPEGARFTVEGYPAESLIELTCDGEDSMMGYHCCLAPGHKGKCWSNQKKVDFTRRIGGWETLRKQRNRDR